MPYPKIEMLKLLQSPSATMVSFQDMLYVWTEPRVCVGGVALPQKKSVPCESLDLWIELGAILGALSAVLLVSLTCYFWKKNKR